MRACLLKDIENAKYHLGYLHKNLLLSYCVDPMRQLAGKSWYLTGSVCSQFSAPVRNLHTVNAPASVPPAAVRCACGLRVSATEPPNKRTSKQRSLQTMDFFKPFSETVTIFSSRKQTKGFWNLLYPLFKRGLYKGSKKCLVLLAFLPIPLKRKYSI